MPRISLLGLAGIALLAVGVVSLATRDSARAATATVNVGDFWFCNPGDTACQTTDSGDTDVTTNINVGDTVQWDWVGGAPHTVTECAGGDLTSCPAPHLFDSPTQSSGSFSHTFAASGTFAYRCDVHLDLMQGLVVVAAQATSTPTTTQAASAPPAPITGAPTSTPAGAPITGDDSSAGLLSWATLLTVAGALLLGSSVVLVLQTISRR